MLVMEPVGMIISNMNLREVRTNRRRTIAVASGGSSDVGVVEGPSGRSRVRGTNLFEGEELQLE